MGKTKACDVGEMGDAEEECTLYQIQCIWRRAKEKFDDDDDDCCRCC